MGAIFPFRFGRRPAATTKEFFYGPVRSAYGEYFRGWFYFDPAFSLDLGRSRLVGVRAFVGNPKAYGDEFKRGDRILEVHFFSRNPRESLRLLLESPKIIPRLRDAGYKGAYGDTTNAQLPRVFMRHTGHIVRPPAYRTCLTRVKIVMLAFWNIVPEQYVGIAYGMPTDLLASKFQRIVMRF